MAFRRTSTHFVPGSFTMPGEYYLSPEIFALEIERIGLKLWHCAGRSERVSGAGDYQLVTVAGESLILVRDRQGKVRAHFNVCRHRGTRLCEAVSGRLSETIQCPYHAWTYALDGRLIGAPHMSEIEGFEKGRYALHQACVAEWEGFLFVNLDPDPVSFEAAFAPIVGRLSRFGLSGLKVGRRVEYDIKANWKLVTQNYSECLHCPMIHPELSDKVPYQSGANDLVEGMALGGYMEITEGHHSVTASGRRCGPLVADLPAEDRRRGYYYTLMPNMFLSIHPDYVNYYLISPQSPTRTIVTSEWLFHPTAFADPDWSPDDAVAIWDATNRQDWHICEQSQAGIGSRRYQPGPYSARESLPAAWDRNYLSLMGR